jgi:hypothetical protein
MFVNPDGDDFRLQPESPCIDSGAAQSGITIDIEGRPRGIQGVAIQRGDGSKFDMGAYEFMPQPVMVLSPNGGETFDAGGPMQIHWLCQTETAGTAVRLELWRGDAKTADLLDAWDPRGNGLDSVTLPPVAGGADYRVRAVSLFNPLLFDLSDMPFVILPAESAADPVRWTLYR